MKHVHQLKNGELFALTIFLSVARHRNFRLAANELNLSPSAISHAIKTLEARLEVPLFNRTTRNVSLTGAGFQLYSTLQPAMENVVNAINQLDTFKQNPSGTLRINASKEAVQILVSPILKHFLAENPLVHLDIVCEGRLINIVEQNFDAGIRLADEVPQEMVAIRLTSQERFVAVASPEYLAKHGRPKFPQELFSHNCIRFRFESGDVFQWEFMIDGKINKFNITGSLTLTAQTLMLEAAIAGIGIAFVSEFLTKKAVELNQVEILLDEFNPVYNGLSLYYPSHRHVSNALRALINSLRL